MHIHITTPLSVEIGILFFQVTITILKNDNQPPVFEDILEQIIYTPKLAGEEVLDLRDYASDPDSPDFGVGEIAFDEIAEDGGAGIIFSSIICIFFKVD